MHDSWILDLLFSMKSTFINIHLINDDLKVSRLINDQQWNNALCKYMFSHELGVSISMIGLPLTPHDDKFIWADSREGNITTAATYSFLLKHDVLMSKSSFNWSAV
ncbi:hypothetical protein Cni_G29122 [Canna indica]|uniref:Uncharacterized protein n=1 Tax=Canna indica TaxID=4628 RepID=A0AAQ3L7R4_9LILI|nr:hypothetical protein Cni_G29122 [Canna indica]